MKIHMKVNIGDVCLWKAKDSLFSYNSLIVRTNGASKDMPLFELVHGACSYGNGTEINRLGAYYNGSDYILEVLINVFNYTEDDLTGFKIKIEEMGIDLQKCLDNMEL